MKKKSGGERNVGVQKWSRQKLGEKSTHTLVIYYQSIKYNKQIHA